MVLIIPTEFTPRRSLFVGARVGIGAVTGLFSQIASIVGITKGLTGLVLGARQSNDRGWRIGLAARRGPV